MNSDAGTPVHPLLAWVVSLGFTEVDLFEAAGRADGIRKFSLTPVTEVREPSEYEVRTLSLSVDRTRMFLSYGRLYALKANPFTSAQKGDGLALQMLSVKSIRRENVSAPGLIRNGSGLWHEPDPGPEEPRVPLDRTPGFEARPFFKEKGVSKPIRSK